MKNLCTNASPTNSNQRNLDATNSNPKYRNSLPTSQISTPSSKTRRNASLSAGNSKNSSAIGSNRCPPKPSQPSRNNSSIAPPKPSNHSLKKSTSSTANGPQPPEPSNNRSNRSPTRHEPSQPPSPDPKPAGSGEKCRSNALSNCRDWSKASITTHKLPTTRAVAPISSSTCLTAGISSSTPKSPRCPHRSPRHQPTKNERANHLNRHARHMQDHADSLASKEYWSQLPDSADFVVMVVPEFALPPAVERRPNLIDRALQQNVVISTHSTLVALLKTVAMGWQERQLADEAQEIGLLGRELHDRLETFAGYYAGMGRALDRAVREYNSGVGSLESRVLTQARRFPQLGVQTTKELPETQPIETTIRSMRTHRRVIDPTTTHSAGWNTEILGVFGRDRRDGFA